MAKYKHLSEEEKQQMLFDWRYRGFTTIEAGYMINSKAKEKPKTNV